MQGADFSEANLKGAIFNKCDLSMAVFAKTNLEKADFTTSYNFEIDPTNNKVRNARFSRYGLAGLVSTFGVKIED